MAKKKKENEKVRKISYSDQELSQIKNDCLSGLEERRVLYDSYGEKVLRNNLKNPLFKHLEDITSLIYFPDNIIFDIIPQIEKEKITKDKTTLLEKLKTEIYEDFISAALDIHLYDIFFWALVYGSYFCKFFITANNEIKIKKVSPYDICVLYEDYQSLDKNQVILHVTRIPKHIAMQRYGADALIEMPEVSAPIRPESRFMSLVYSQTKGKVPAQDDLWAIDRDLPPIPKAAGRYVELYEMWLWDEAIDDYLMVQFIGNKIIKSNNPFVPKEQPIIGFIANPLENYFFGLSEIHFLYPIQDRLKDQIEKINFNEKMLSEPPMLVSGLTGSIEAQEIREKLNKPREVIEIIDPTAKIDFYIPKITMDVLYKSLEYWENSFKEMSGIMGILGGRPMPNVRSGSYASILAQFASAPLKKKALRAEYFIETMMTLFASIKTKIFEKYALISGLPFRVDVYAHTSSPIVATYYQDMLIGLAEAGLIPAEILIDVLSLPKKDDIKEYLRLKKLAGLQNAAEKSKEETEMA